MDFVEVLRTLWRRRFYVAVAAILAVFAGLGAGYDVGLAPPSVKARSVDYGTASAKVLVDTAPTTLTDSGVDYEPLVIRANVYARLFSAASVRRYISRFSRIPSDRIVTEVPSNGRLITNQPSENNAAGPTQRSRQISSEQSGYRLDVDVEADLPIIELVAQAPTQTAAVGLVNGASAGIQTYVRALRPIDPNGRVVRVRRLGNAAGSTVGSTTGPLAAILVAMGIFLLGALLIVILSGVADRWRQDHHDRHAVEPSG